MCLSDRFPVWIVAVLVALVAMATSNLSGIGIGSWAFTYDSVALPRIVVAAVLTCAAWTAWLVRANRDRVSLRVDIVWALLGALAAWAVVSAAVSPHRVLSVLGQSERLEGVVTIALYAFVYGLALQVVRHVRDASIVMTALGGASALLGLYGLLQYAGLDPATYAFESYGFGARKAFATFGNPNFFAGLLVLALPLQVAMVSRARHSAVRIGWAAAAVVSVAALVVTFTRGAWLAAVVEIVVGAIIWQRMRTGAMSRLMKVSIAAAVIVVGALVAVSLTAPSDANVAERVTDAFSGSGSASERLRVFTIAADATLDRPLVGYGPDAFLPAFRLHRSDAYVDAFGEYATVNNVHSWPLQYAATLGIPGALLLIFALAAGLWRTRRLVFEKQMSQMEERGGGIVLMAAAWVGCLGFVVHMLLSVAVPGSVIPFWILLGIVGSPFSRAVDLPARAGRVALVVAASFTVCAVIGSVALMSADATYLASRRAFRGGSSAGAVELSERARTLNPLSVKYARGTAEVYAERVDAAIASGQPDTVILGRYDEAFEQFSVHLSRSPDDYVGFAWLAALQARTGARLDDTTLLKKAVSTAQCAEEFDRQGAAVVGIASGDMSDEAIRSARVVPGLP